MVMRKRYRAERLIPAGARVGESPRWNPSTERLVWVDNLAGVIHVTDPARAADEEFPVGGPLGAMALRVDGSYLLPQPGRLTCWAPHRSPTALAEMEADRPRRRPNDGAVDPAGRLLLGTMDNDPSPDKASGILYCVEPDLTIRPLARRLRLPNGIDWSPDGTTLYFTDSFDQAIGVFDYDADAGSLRGARAMLPVPAGLPDGHTVDTEGNLWVALWSTGTVACLSPDGRVLATIEVPVRNVTACAFGGPGMDTLFITTMQPSDATARELMAGDLFACDVGASGAPPTRFAG